jgi:L-cystine uptake protein TcyP (sodium:dicarboxylate symporter family)
MDHGSTQLLQALILMAQYLQTLNLSNRCWVVVGMAIRVAQGFALHLDVEGESQAQREERRRTWYSCVLLDRYVRFLRVFTSIQQTKLKFLTSI